MITVDLATAYAELSQRGYSYGQIAEAAAIVELDHIAPGPNPGEWAVCSKNGDVTYYADRWTCVCPAGRFGRRCKHRAAVWIKEEGYVEAQDRG